MAPKLVVIVGETASGKSALAMELAIKFNGEIICADSRTVYKGMDIGTAKPTAEDQRLVRHHLLDVVTPDKPFTAADFKKLANRSIIDIHSRRKLPIMVGGSGLYVDSVLYDYKFAGPADVSLRQKLESMSLEELYSYATDHEVFLGHIDRKNKRAIIRAIEKGGFTDDRKTMRPYTLVIGLQVPREALKNRIKDRIDEMIDRGILDEAQRLAKDYGWEYEAHTIYSLTREYFEGVRTIDEVKESLFRSHHNLAKRQRTWFKRNKSIHWLNDPRKAVEFVTTFLNT